MRSLKRILQAPAAQRAIGFGAAEFLRFVRKTSRLVIEPPDIYERIERHLPVIVTMWHGQHFLLPFASRGHRVKALISRHRDGEMNAIAAARLGVGAIRGSGATDDRFDRKGGVGAFLAMRDALERGYSVALTADVPKIARVAGAGVVKLARMSARMVYPVAIATSRRIELDTWDRAAINLPFSRMAMVAGEPIAVPPDATAEDCEACRIAIEHGLNAATARARALADRNRDGDRYGDGRG